MSGTSISSTASTDGKDRWAALDQRNERLCEPSHPLLLELARQRLPAQADDEQLPAAS